MNKTDSTIAKTMMKPICDLCDHIIMVLTMPINDNAILGVASSDSSSSSFDMPKWDKRQALKWSSRRLGCATADMETFRPLSRSAIFVKENVAAMCPRKMPKRLGHYSSLSVSENTTLSAAAHQRCWHVVATVMRACRRSVFRVRTQSFSH
jgi:hypothetical protein